MNPTLSFNTVGIRCFPPYVDRDYRWPHLDCETYHAPSYQCTLHARHQAHREDRSPWPQGVWSSSFFIRRELAGRIRDSAPAAWRASRRFRPDSRRNAPERPSASLGLIMPATAAALTMSVEETRGKAVDLGIAGGWIGNCVVHMSWSCRCSCGGCRYP